MSYTKHHNFLSKEDLNIVGDEAFGYMQDPSTSYTTNFSKWDPNIVRDSNVVLMKHLVDNGKVINEQSKATKTLNQNFKNKYSSSPDGLSIFYWSKGSYIPWHDDDDKSRACTLYLNDKWDPWWGGYFVARLEEDSIMIKPEQNLMIEQTNNIWHCTTPTTSFADVRISIQAFWK